MAEGTDTTWATMLVEHQDALLADWVREQLAAVTLRADLLSAEDLRRESGEFIALLSAAADEAPGGDLSQPGWGPVKDYLGDVARSRALAGFTPSETATFVFSLKQPLFSLLKTVFPDPVASMRQAWDAGIILDKLGLYTTEVTLQAREQVIKRQQAEMLELSTPVVRLWDGILALPLIGTLDSARTQVVMESLLEAIVDTGSGIAIIDITGVPTVDTLVAQHLLKTVAAARLMGATCIVSGIRPQIAQTMVHLGVGFEDVRTTASLKDALAQAFHQRGLVVSPARQT